MKRRRKSIAAALLLLAAIASGCASEPRPFEPGAETAPPIGCSLLRQRKGEC